MKIVTIGSKDCSINHYVKIGCLPFALFAQAECKGILEVAGTGPWVFKEKKTSRTTYSGKQPNEMCTLADDESVEYVLFEHNPDYWGGAPDVESVRVVRYESHEQARGCEISIFVGS